MFLSSGGMKTTRAELSVREQRIVDTVRVRPVRSAAERARCLRLLERHHYLGALQAVGEQIFYIAHGPNGKGRRYPSPSQPTFCRLLQHVPAEQVEAALLAFQAQVRGPTPREGVAAVDGKAVRRSGGEMILSAVSVPSLHYLGSAPVPTDKTNEIPVARELLQRLDVEGRLVGLDALHTQMETACRIVQEAGGDYMLTAKDNQKGIRRTVQGLMAGTPAAFSPSAPDANRGLDRRDESGAPGTSAIA
jgi:hypothetical protein